LASSLRYLVMFAVSKAPDLNRYKEVKHAEPSPSVRLPWTVFPLPFVSVKASLMTKRGYWHTGMVPVNALQSWVVQTMVEVVGLVTLMTTQSNL